MEPRDISVTIRRTVRITINDPDVIDRCVNNTNGWRDAFYDIRTEQGVFERLASLYIVYGQRAHEIDGWADISRDAVEYELLP